MAPTSMATVPFEHPDAVRHAEQRVILHAIPWWQYLALRDATEGRGLKLTYLEGDLEIMSPSDLHEEAKKIMARLIEAYAEERELDIWGFGSTTYRDETKSRGLEPDECYNLSKPSGPGAVPDLAIEIIVSRGLIDKMAVYAGLGVKEVWSWRPGKSLVEVHCLNTSGTYEVSTGSALLPELDLSILSQFVRPGGESHTKLVKAYRAAIRSA